MISITGLSSSKYALYLLSKDLSAPLEVLWQLATSSTSSNRTEIAIQVNSIIELLNPIQFDVIDENSRNSYPLLSIDLLKVIIVYYGEISRENGNSVALPSLAGEVIQRVWEFCRKTMTIQLTNSIAPALQDDVY